MQDPATPRRAFTVIELLVVIAILVLLMGLLLPVVSGVRDRARETVCAAQQRNLHVSAMLYGASNQHDIPSVNTTGRAYFASVAKTQEMLGDSTPETPTTTFDWISPIMGASAGLSPNRAVRTKQIFEELGCPSAGEVNQVLWGWAPDRAGDFQRLIETEGIGQISYLAPGPFHLAGPGRSASKYKRFGWLGPAVPPRNYLPKLTNVGHNMATKIFVADGTRYLADDGRLDFDVSPRPEYYGSFTSSTPIYNASTAYGIKPNSPQFAAELGAGRGGVSARNRELSYRHRGGIIATRFDGSSSWMSEEASKTDAAPWYPSGSVFTGVRATDESLAKHAEGDVLP